MPSKYSAKNYLENGYYHIYNRGVEKRQIFLDEQDYNVFTSYLKEYLLPKNEKELLERLLDKDISTIEKDNILKLLRLNNFAEEINLLGYALMPNHFHFIVKQNNANSIDKFMNSFATRYTIYFNKKYKRVGGLYQDVYKGVLVDSDEQLIHLSGYIHRQTFFSNKLFKTQPSSYKEYLGERKSDWIKPEEILSFFSQKNPNLTYQSFINEGQDINLINNILLE